jgi:hypothetical protein
MQIKPLTTLSHAEVAALAHNAADNGAPLHTCNLFEPVSEHHSWFTRAYLDRQRQLRALAD